MCIVHWRLDSDPEEGEQHGLTKALGQTFVPPPYGRDSAASLNVRPPHQNCSQNAIKRRFNCILQPIIILLI